MDSPTTPIVSRPNSQTPNKGSFKFDARFSSGVTSPIIIIIEVKGSQRKAKKKKR